MAKRRRQNKQPDIISISVLAVAGIWVSLARSQFNTALLLATLLLVAIAIASIFFYLNYRKNEQVRRSGIAEIDLMSGIQFENYLKLLLEQHGYERVRLTTTYDLGVDLIAKKGENVWAIQAKRYKGAVGLDAIRQVVAAMNYYGCNKSMVITNSYFTQNAQTIAASSHCMLVDRSSLIELILKKEN
ncbi:MAG: restriction endonuclease family protein [Candidatus Saccharibacteria bacterium]|nr:restriction endonuclease family protein [Candidatus Saccharibacteria bacterium]